jgi:hypothetical protein
MITGLSSVLSDELSLEDAGTGVTGAVAGFRWFPPCFRLFVPPPPVLEELLAADVLDACVSVVVEPADDDAFTLVPEP